MTKYFPGIVGGSLLCNLSFAKWHLVVDLHITSKPVMLAKECLEGEGYVIITLISSILYRVRLFDHMHFVVVNALFIFNS